MNERLDRCENHQLYNLDREKPNYKLCSEFGLLSCLGKGIFITSSQ
jgi:hypothetical protein